MSFAIEFDSLVPFCWVRMCFGWPCGKKVRPTVAAAVQDFVDIGVQRYCLLPCPA
jgi:hypothetical protein